VSLQATPARLLPLSILFVPSVLVVIEPVAVQLVSALCMELPVLLPLG